MVAVDEVYPRQTRLEPGLQIKPLILWPKPKVTALQQDRGLVSSYEAVELGKVSMHVTGYHYLHGSFLFPSNIFCKR
jgi:hypothetical protein